MDLEKIERDFKFLMQGLVKEARILIDFFMPIIRDVCAENYLLRRENLTAGSTVRKFRTVRTKVLNNPVIWNFRAITTDRKSYAVNYYI